MEGCTPSGTTVSGTDPRRDGGAGRPGAAAGLPRRAVLRTSGAAVLGGTVLAAVGATAAGCTLGTQEPETDPLQLLADQAASDADLARRLAAASPDSADAATVISDERRAHADALTAEIHRAAGTTPGPDPGAGDTAGTPAPSVPADGGAGGNGTPPPPPPPPPTVAELRAALAAAQRAAADAAHGLDGYRAGLAGAVSAACAAEQKVLIP